MVKLQSHEGSPLTWYIVNFSVLPCPTEIHFPTQMFAVEHSVYHCVCPTMQLKNATSFLVVKPTKSVPRKISHRGISTAYVTARSSNQFFTLSMLWAAFPPEVYKKGQTHTVPYEPLYIRVKVVIIGLCGTKVFPRKWLFTIVGNRPGSIILLLVLSDIMW